MNSTLNGTAPVEQDRVEPVSKSSKYGSDDVLYVVALATLGQAMCFLVVSMLLDDVTVLPTDPLTIIGTAYVVMGTLFMIISCLLHKMKISQTSTSKDKTPTAKLNLKDIGVDSSLDDPIADAPCECGFRAPSEHQTESDGKTNIGSDTSEVIQDSHEDADTQWQILDTGSGVRARNLPVNSKTTKTNDLDCN